VKNRVRRSKVDAILATPPEIRFYEFKHAIATYLAELDGVGRPTTLSDLIAFNEAHAAEEMALFAQEKFYEARAKGDLTDTFYLEALA
jgi:amidase